MVLLKYFISGARRLFLQAHYVLLKIIHEHKYLLHLGFAEMFILSDLKL